MTCKTCKFFLIECCVPGTDPACADYQEKLKVVRVVRAGVVGRHACHQTSDGKWHDGYR